MKLNRPGWRIIHDDIANISCLDLEDYFGIKKGELDLLSGGAPCQAFSYAGKRLGLEDDDCAGFLVEAIAKRSQNMKWTTRVDGKNVQHRLIRRVSMDQFYAIVTGDENAFYKMCMALPEVNHIVVNEEGRLHDQTYLQSTNRGLFLLL